jgi:hypothetical protein
MDAPLTIVEPEQRSIDMRDDDTGADPLWYKDAVIYELHIKAYADANGKVPSVGDTVDVANATWTNTIGAPELIAIWKDAAFDPAQRALYAAFRSSRVAGFRLDQSSGRLTAGDVQPTGTSGHQHVSIDPTVGLLLGASYGGGAVVELRVRAGPDDGEHDGGRGNGEFRRQPRGPGRAS